MTATEIFQWGCEITIIVSFEISLNNLGFPEFVLDDVFCSKLDEVFLLLVLVAYKWEMKAV